MLHSKILKTDVVGAAETLTRTSTQFYSNMNVYGTLLERVGISYQRNTLRSFRENKLRSALIHSSAGITSCDIAYAYKNVLTGTY